MQYHGCRSHHSDASLDTKKEENLPVKENQDPQQKATPTRSPISGEVLLCVSVDLAGAELSLRNEELGALADARVGAMQLSLSRTTEKTFIKTRYMYMYIYM